MFLLYYRHILFDVPKVLKMSPHFQRWWDKCPLIFRGDGTNVPSFLNPRQNTAHNLTSTWCSLNHCVTGKLTLLPNQQCRLNVWQLYSIYRYPSQGLEEGVCLFIWGWGDLINKNMRLHCHTTPEFQIWENNMISNILQGETTCKRIQCVATTWGIAPS